MYRNGSNTTESDIFGTVSGSSWYFVMIAVIVTITGFLQMLLWYWTASHQVKVMRMHFFKSVMRQDMAWHDQHASGAIASSLARLERGCLSHIFHIASIFSNKMRLQFILLGFNVAFKHLRSYRDGVYL